MQAKAVSLLLLGALCTLLLFPSGAAAAKRRKWPVHLLERRAPRIRRLQDHGKGSPPLEP
jgi:hypothetical protein